VKRSKRINVIKRLRAQAERESMSLLSQALSAHQQVLARYHELVKFRQEYQQTLLETGRQGLAANRIQSFHSFLQNLNSAIDAQSKMVEQQQSHVEAMKEKWRMQRKALTGVENWAEQVEKQERKIEDQKEQKELDELSIRRYVRGG